MKGILILTMKNKNNLLNGLLFFIALIAGLSVAIGFEQPHKRLLNWLHGGDHSAHQTGTDFNLWQANLNFLDGQNTHLAEQIGDKPFILVNFWATWCPPCVKEMPLLDQAYGQGDIAIVGITYEDTATIANFLQNISVTYPILQIGQNNLDEYFSYLRQNGNPTASLPFTILLDKSGQIIRRRVGEFHSPTDITEFIADAQPLEPLIN